MLRANRRCVCLRPLPPKVLSALETLAKGEFGSRGIITRQEMTAPDPVVESPSQVP